MNNYKEKALELFEKNLNLFFNAELSEIKNRGTAKANTIFWIEQIISSCPCKANYLGIGKSEWVLNIEKWENILKEVEQINI